MPADCAFCRIVAREAEASVVYEDAVTLAFVDLRQLAGGHALVVPKSHVPDIFALDDDTGAAVMRAAGRVARAVQSTFVPDGLNVWQSSGAAAGQEVLHFHLHILPRREGDGLLRLHEHRPDYPSRAELDRQADRLRSAIA